MHEEALMTRYREHSPRSAAFAERAARAFPGGDTRSSAHYAPYPLAVEKGKGCVITDLDGHELLDFMNNFTSLIHGHAHPDVVAAIGAQAARGTAYAAPSEAQVQLAELMIERVPSIERLRFTSSGTEGTQMAIRCARAVTGRHKVMKMEGGYHGSYELAEVSLVPLPGAAGAIDAPVSLPVDDSFPDSVLRDTVVCPYNEPALARSLIEQHADELAAVIVEPVLGSMGMLPASAAFLRTLREETSRHGIVLVFDEVITLRLSSGGAQAQLGIEPDLTCFGKIVGGGLPIGGVGGARELINAFHPASKKPVMHASTFSGNALSMAAGLAAMRAFTPDECERINALGDRLRDGFNQVLSQRGIRGQATGVGSLVNLHFTAQPMHNARDTMAAIIGARRAGCAAAPGDAAPGRHVRQPADVLRQHRHERDPHRSGPVVFQRRPDRTATVSGAEHTAAVELNWS